MQEKIENWIIMIIYQRVGILLSLQLSFECAVAM